MKYIKKKTVKADLIHFKDIYKINLSEKIAKSLEDTFHEEIEIKLCVEGSFGVSINQDFFMMEPGSISIVNPYEVHSIFSNEELGVEGRYYYLIIGLDVFDYIEDGDVLKGKIVNGQIKFKNFVRRNDRLETIINRIVLEEKEEKLYYRVILKSLLIELFVLLLREEVQINIDVEEEKTRIKQIIAPSLSYIHANYATKITLEKLAELCCISKNHFCRIFKEIMGITPFQYIMSYRLNVAESMLKNSDKSCADIAECCGFQDESYFCRCYKREKGVSPSKTLK